MGKRREVVASSAYFSPVANLSFSHPWLAWTALLLWLAGMAWLGISWRRQHRWRAQLRLQSLPLRPRWRASALLTALSLTILSAAEPATSKAGESPAGEAVDLVVALDLSRSMLSEDVAPSRLGRAKEILYDLINNPPKQLRLGLVVFAGQAFVQMPLSPDLVTAQLQLQAAQPANLPVQGTAIAAALQRGAALLDNKEIRQKNLWLFTDGENHEPGMDESISALRKLGTVITTVGFGTVEGAPINNPYTGNPQQDADGNPIITKPNVALLKEIAAGTNGSYVDGNDLNAASRTLRNQLSQSSGRMGQGAVMNQESLAFFPLGIALLLMIFWLLTTDTGKRKLEVAAMLFCLSLPQLLMAQQGQPDYAACYRALQAGNASYQKGDWAEADLQYQQAARHPRLRSVTTYNRALVAYQQKQFGPAAEQFAGLTAHRQVLMASRAANNQGLSLARQQLYQQAVDAFKQALRTDPNDRQARENLQLALHKLKQQKPPPPDKNDPDKKKNQPPPPKQMNRQQADDLLNQLRQKEAQLRKQLQRRPQGEGGQSKDW